MTTFDTPTALTTADATLNRLRSGAPLSPLERLGLAELLLIVKAGDTVAGRPGHDSAESRSGLWRNVQAAFRREFGPVSSDTKEDGTDV